MQVQFPFSIVEKDGKAYIRFMTMGPDDGRHPGLPAIQSAKLKSALDAGIRLMRTASWLGLPRPAEIGDPVLFTQAVHGAPQAVQPPIVTFARILARAVGNPSLQAAAGGPGSARV